MSVHVRPEPVFTLNRNDCSPWAGICSRGANRCFSQAGLSSRTSRSAACSVFALRRCRPAAPRSSACRRRAGAPAPPRSVETLITPRLRPALPPCRRPRMPLLWRPASGSAPKHPPPSMTRRLSSTRDLRRYCRVRRGGGASSTSAICCAVTPSEWAHTASSIVCNYSS